ncbi:helix-turn-helix domain-containing protein [Dyadobacter frigoris]|uniref:Helix-turn-helix domain-containing protein n=1 Tax=Dyadobacter frigoris TaxID=2576211 RepID=A0A4U6CTR0_9BACT|nr:helix-turn-helix domain-containing protein [Dyadobacter frigoris]TKT88070.1 helix-turn-helix domain-containing protein [Dyadobacter frigoris]GLU53679.1 AraC family transcriptional regulator [Dyadobacter frigoris]
MTNSETVQEFYSRVPAANRLGLPMNNAGAGHFNVFSRESCAVITPYSRRDFYKVSLIIGTGKLHYADKWIAIDRPALLFSNPVVPYSWEAESQIQQGWFCLFTEAFLQPDERNQSLQESPLFKIGGNPIFFIDDLQLEEVSGIFKKMMREIASEYTHKYSLLRNYLHLIIHEAMKMNPAENFEKHVNASSRITSLFIELLERQFPIDTPEAALKMKTANDYALNLSVHVNHLNRSVKETTGKTTTEHIASRITREAHALLQHTDWDISEIAYSLGFEYPAYFTNFFKKHIGVPPGEIRNPTV